MYIVLELLAQVRKTGTVIRPDLINGTFVILQVEELAGCPLIHPVAFAAPLLLQVFLLELGDSHLEMSGNPFEVFGIVSRRHGLTAVGTGQTICFFPYFFFQNSNLFIQTAGGLFFQLGKKATHGCFPVTGFGFERPEIDRGYFTHGPEDND